MTKELMPCPFCGHAARLVHDTHSDYERHWRWNVECTNFDKCEAELTGFSVAESAVEKWNARCAAYVHRNGETEPPTMPGKYWFKGRRFHKWRDAKDGEWIDDTGILLDRDRDGTIDPYGSYWTCGDFIDSKGQWWGPVEPPWTKG